jgi:caffeoyl-CoA O-methyltransferase
MEFLAPEIEDYSLAHTTAEDPILAALNRETFANVLMPRMLSGPLQGKLLEFIASMLRPKRILEIGTYTGYSAICLARGLSQDGLLHTIEINDELEKMARGFVEKAGLTEKIIFHFQDALECIPKLHETWDLVFIDADKENYARYFELVLPSVRGGGFIVADNVLWSGKVTQAHENLDAETRGIVDFNQMVQGHPEVENLLLPVRDGLMIIRKK